MAKVVKCFPVRFKSKYKKWCDGQVWRLEIKRDFINISNLQEGVKRCADKLGKKAKIRCIGQSCYIQVK